MLLRCERSERCFSHPPAFYLFTCLEIQIHLWAPDAIIRLAGVNAIDTVGPRAAVHDSTYKIPHAQRGA